MRKPVVHYLGEIDCPDDLYDIEGNCRSDLFRGKLNYFESEDGTIFSCGDCAAEYIFQDDTIIVI